MNTIKPNFFDRFKCKASACGDTCCAGWEIDVDNESYNKYKSVNSEFGRYIISNTVNVDGQYCFKLDKNDRCVFLDSKGLCDIYSNLGEKYLCEICREHPRFYDCYDDVTEMGLGLCCEKVCEMLFDTDDPFELVYEYDDGFLSEEIKFLLKIREDCFAILRNNEQSFTDKIKKLLIFTEYVQSANFGVESDVAKFNCKDDACKYIVLTLSRTEPINDKWIDYIEYLKCNVKNIILCAEDYQPNEKHLEKLLMYVLYRHFMKCRFDGNILAIVRFALMAVIFTYICECDIYNRKKRVDIIDRINIVKMWSQQIEYSEENTEFCLSV